MFQKHLGHHSAAFTKWNFTLCVSHKPPKREFNPEYLNLLDKRKKRQKKGKIQGRKLQERNGKVRGWDWVIEKATVQSLTVTESYIIVTVGHSWVHENICYTIIIIDNKMQWICYILETAPYSKRNVLPPITKLAHLYKFWLKRASGRKRLTCLHTQQTPLLINSFLHVHSSKWWICYTCFVLPPLKSTSEAEFQLWTGKRWLYCGVYYLKKSAGLWGGLSHGLATKSSEITCWKTTCPMLGEKAPHMVKNDILRRAANFFPFLLLNHQRQNAG